ncbi:MAG: transglutaminase family protein [Gemmatimonadota bacterium]
MRLLVQHRSTWRYTAAAMLGPHVIRLRPATHARVAIDDYRLRVEPAGELRWQQDPTGNHVARLTFPTGTRTEALVVSVQFACDVRTTNPFDFFVDERCTSAPFVYPDELRADLAALLDRTEPSLFAGARFVAFLDALPFAGDTVQLLVQLNAAVHRAITYVEREEPGIWTPEATLAAARGSCRDSAVLLMAVLRHRGIAARFVSGYLVQLAHESPITGQASLVPEDSVALHAWAEAYLPGAGWIGLDATSGLLCGEGHIPLACTSSPALAAPVEGTSDSLAESVQFRMQVERLAAGVT